MSPMEIALLMIGIIIFAASFIIPELKQEPAPREGAVPEEQVKKAVREEMEDYEGRLQEVVDETVHYAVEKTERSLDKLSNEKIMAVNEYSDTVLEEIDRNHKEVVFLYDMLNDKESKLKNMVQEAEKIANAARKTVEVIDEKTRTAKETAEVVEDTISTVKAAVAGNKKEPEPAGQKAAEAEESRDGFIEGIGKELRDEEKSRLVLPAEKAPQPETELHFDLDGDAGKNSNERILELHQQGKSKMAIAKNLGLGLGEVQLVIDLFEGAKA